MSKKLSLFFFFLLLVSCGATPKTKADFPKKKKRTELISKASYRAQQKKETVKVEVKSEIKTETEVLEATSKLSVTNDNIRTYIMKFKDAAQQNMKDHGIPASITLAQGVLESGSGFGSLSQRANNHFGIKCHQGWEGESVKHDDDAPEECFRKYVSPEESYKDHALFLTKRGRYSKLFLLDKGDYVGWAKGLRAAGYATDVKYPEKLISLIERYELYTLDAEVLGANYVPVPLSASVVVSSNNRGANTVSVSDGKVYRVTSGDTLFSISKRHNISVVELQKLNNLSSNSISIGQILKVK